MACDLPIRVDAVHVRNREHSFFGIGSWLIKVLGEEFEHRHAVVESFNLFGLYAHTHFELRQFELFVHKATQSVTADPRGIDSATQGQIELGAYSFARYLRQLFHVTECDVVQRERDGGGGGVPRSRGQQHWVCVRWITPAPGVSARYSHTGL